MPENRFNDLFAEANQAFDGKYKDQINALKGMSKKDIEAITPITTDPEILNKLIKTVEQAAKENLSQAQLIDNIKSLGELAVKIVKKIPAFVALL